MIGGAEIAQFPSLPDTVAFHRTELSVILGLYGRAVAAGLWRDYGISMLRDAAVFSIFRHSAEHPIYRIEKRPGSPPARGSTPSLPWTAVSSAAAPTSEPSSACWRPSSSARSETLAAA